MTTRPIRTILTLDGGGTNGRLQAVFLAELERALGFPLRDVFDALGATSVGALIGGALFYNPELTALDGSDTVFTQDNSIKMMWKGPLDGTLLQPFPKYSGDTKRELIDRFVPDVPMGSPPKKNLVAIAAYDVSRGKGVFFKSYDPHDPKRNVSIREVLDATSAAPGYYPSVRITGAFPKNGAKTEYAVDGGLFANNPTDSIYADLAELWPGCDLRVLSVGSGIKPSKPIGNKARKVRRPFRWLFGGPKYDEVPAGEATQTWGGIQWLTDGDLIMTIMDAPLESIHYRMERFTRVLGHQYIRANIDLGKQRAIDDASEENFAELSKLGVEMFRQYRDEILAMLAPRLEELRQGTQWDRDVSAHDLRVLSERIQSTKGLETSSATGVV